MIERLRRHARLIAGALALLLVAGAGFALRSAGSADAQAGGAVGGRAEVRAIAPVLAPAAQRTAGQATLTSQRRGATAARATTPRPGVRTPAPSPGGAALALRRVTGLSPAQVSSHAVCPRPTPGHATCAAQALVLRSTGALVRPHASRYSSLGAVQPASGSGAEAASVAAASPPAADTPAYLQQAYDLSYLAKFGGSGDTVAVVDAYDDPTAATDLAYYRSYNGLPACTTTSGCLRKVGQTGSGSLPRPDSRWEQEIALDLDAVSAICPQCHILLVEARSNSFGDLQTAMQTAANMGANQISASWWGVSSTVPSGFGTFPGVALVAATGDSGYPGPDADNYPAAVPGVTAAGGTSLGPAATPTARGFGETAWSGGGSGCDLQFPRPAYQPAAGCAGRAYADLSADADPSTGLMVYDHGTWSLVGGTSLSTPVIAAYYALTGVAGATPEWAYGHSGTLNDVVTGSSGSCAASIAYICNAGTGYDGPTGVGSISGSVAVGAPGIGGPGIPSPTGSGNTYTASVSAHGATITGGIYRNRLDTQWWIEYGTTTSYGQKTPAGDIGSGSAPVTVTGSLSGLTSGTTYHYRLVAQNSRGVTYGYDYTLKTQPGSPAGPTASFSVSPSTPAVGHLATFDASGSMPGTIGPISGYSWNFGDGVTDTTTEPTDAHTYTSRGTYAVTLTVTSNGQSDTSTQTVTVDDSAARFTPASTAVPAGTTINFNAGASSTGAGGSITDYSWNFGDGSASSVDAGANALQSHAFPTPGTYTVALTTTDDLNVTSTASAQITVAPFTATTTTGSLPAPGDEVTFYAQGAAPGSTYMWDFGDSSQDAPQGQSVTHAYLSRGSYTVTLTIENGMSSSSSTATVIVDTPPNPQFSPAPAAVLPGAPVHFDASGSTAAGSGAISDYSWNFGDGTPTEDTGASPTAATHAFTARGVYTVTLTATDDLGAMTPVTQQVTVDQPTAAFTASASGTAPAATVSFDASASSDPDSAIADYSWDFGDGTSVQDAGASAATSHVYTAAGTYTVMLTVTDALNLPATTSQQIVVSPAVSDSSGQSTSTSPTPTSTSTTPAPTPPAPTPPPGGAQTPLSASLQLIGTSRQRMTRVLAHGLHLGLTLNQPVRASFQLMVPPGEVRHMARRKTPVVLQRAAQMLGAGKTTITLKLSRAAVRRLRSGGSVVLTIRVTLSAADGATTTRTAKVTLTR